MSSVVLLTARDCHMCAFGREVLDTLAAERVVEWEEVDADSPKGLLLAATAPPLRPALFDADDHLLAYGRLSEKRLRRQLGMVATGSPAPTEVLADPVATMPSN